MSDKAYQKTRYVEEGVTSNCGDSLLRPLQARYAFGSNAYLVKRGSSMYRLLAEGSFDLHQASQVRGIGIDCSIRVGGFTSAREL
jgi:hypothetical protein